MPPADSQASPAGHPAPRLRVADLAAATPADRDRYVDLLRAASICAVMFGHWMVAVVERTGHTVLGTNALAEVAWLRGATWLVQVMPIFFFVGGFSNLRAIDHASRLGGTWRSYLQRRVDRLLRPTMVFAVVWLVIAVALQAGGADLRTAHLAARIAAQPLWFLAVYLLVVGLAPPMATLHHRRPVATLAVLGGSIVAVDVIRLGLDHPGPALVNYAFVFLFAQQLGFAYGDGSLPALGAPRLLAGAGASFVVLVLLTTVGPYPVSMVGVPGEAVSNMSPPTVCIALLTVTQVGVLMCLRDRANRWLARPRAWSITVAVNARIMTLFLWHLTALAVAAVALIELGLPTEDPGSVRWWLLRPVWFASAGVVLAVAVAAFGRFESPRTSAASLPDRPVWPAVAGLVLVVRGFIGLAQSGFDRVLIAHAKPFLGTSLSPAAAVGCILVGWLAIRGRAARGGEV